MKRENAYSRFRRGLAQSAEKAGVTPDRVVDGVLFAKRVNATTPATSRTVRAGSRRSPASRTKPAPV
jgi:hypothetical protein